MQIVCANVTQVFQADNIGERVFNRDAQAVQGSVKK